MRTLEPREFQRAFKMAGSSTTNLAQTFETTFQRFVSLSIRWFSTECRLLSFFLSWNRWMLEVFKKTRRPSGPTLLGGSLIALFVSSNFFVVSRRGWSDRGTLMFAVEMYAPSCDRPESAAGSQRTPPRSTGRSIKRNWVAYYATAAVRVYLQYTRELPLRRDNWRKHTEKLMSRARIAFSFPCPEGRSLTIIFQTRRKQERERERGGEERDCLET